MGEWRWSVEVRSLICTHVGYRVLYIGCDVWDEDSLKMNVRFVSIWYRIGAAVNKSRFYRRN